LAASKPLRVPLWLVGGRSFHRQPADSDLGQSPTAEFHAANRKGKAHAHFLEPVDQGQIDLLLDIHVPVVVGRLHDVDHLVSHPAFIEGKKMGAIKFHLIQSVDDALYQLANLTRLIARRVVGDAEREDDAAGSHALIVVHDLPEQISVRADHLLAAQRAYAGAFQPDVLNGAGHRPKHHEIADLERLVDTDGQRGEHIA